MALHNTALRLKRLVKNTTPDVKYCRFLPLAREVVIGDIMRAVWPVIEGVAHRHGPDMLAISVASTESFGVVH